MEDLEFLRERADVAPEGIRDPDAPGAEQPQDNSETRLGGSPSPVPTVSPIPDSPTLSVQLLSSHPLSVQPPPAAASCEKKRTAPRAPVIDHGKYDHLSYDQLREQCKKRSYKRKDSKVALKTRLASMDVEESKRTLTGDNAMNTSVSVTGKRGRTPLDVAEYLDGPVKRCCADALRVASVPDKEVVNQRASGGILS